MPAGLHSDHYEENRFDNGTLFHYVANLRTGHNIVHACKLTLFITANSCLIINILSRLLLPAVIPKLRLISVFRILLGYHIL